MKRFDKIKTIQMMLTAALAVIALVIVFRDAELYQLIGQNVHIRALSILLWAALGLSFLFMFLDIRVFSGLRYIRTRSREWRTETAAMLT